MWSSNRASYLCIPKIKITPSVEGFPRLVALFLDSTKYFLSGGTICWAVLSKHEDVEEGSLQYCSYSDEGQASVTG